MGSGSDMALRLIKALCSKGRDSANAEIVKVRLSKGTAYAKAYASIRYRHCLKVVNGTRLSDRYSFFAGQAGAFGWMAANGYVMPACPKGRKVRS